MIRSEIPTGRRVEASCPRSPRLPKVIILLLLSVAILSIANSSPADGQVPDQDSVDSPSDCLLQLDCEEDSNGTDQLPRDQRRIRVEPESGGPGSPVSVSLTDGAGFHSLSEIAFGYATPGHRGSALQVETSFLSPEKLQFEVPINAGCGIYTIRVVTDLKVSDDATFEVIGSCNPVPAIASVSKPSGAPGEIVSVTGTGLMAGAVAIFHRAGPGSPWTERVPSEVITLPQQRSIESGLSLTTIPFEGSRLTIRVPFSDPGCGENILVIENPDTMPMSNALDFGYSCPSNTLNVLSYNVQMLVEVRVDFRPLIFGFPPLIGHAESGASGLCVVMCESEPWACISLCNLQKDSRVDHIARSPVLAYRDVIVLQEAFSNKHRGQILTSLREQYPFQTRVVGHDDALHQDGGVMILSKWPILNSPGSSREFGSTCAGDTWAELVDSGGTNLDCLARKGIIYAKILKEDRVYHVLGTHFDAGNDIADQRVRTEQLQILSELMGKLTTQPSEAVIVAGDFNMPLMQDPAGSNLPQSLSAAVVPYSEDVGPFCAGSQSTSLVSRNPRLDYILYSQLHEKPLRDRSGSKICEVRGGPKETFHGNLSDHHAVLSTFVFE